MKMNNEEKKKLIIRYVVAVILLVVTILVLKGMYQDAEEHDNAQNTDCLLYTSPSPRDA